MLIDSVGFVKKTVEGRAPKTRESRRRRRRGRGFGRGFGERCSGEGI